MKLIITGATGFIGRHLIKKLLQNKHEVHIVCRTSSNLDFFEPIKSKITFHTYDDGYESLKNIFSLHPFDCTIHLASHFVAAHTDQDMPSLAKSNIELGLYVLEAMAANNQKNIVYTGTNWQNGSASEYNPVNLYAATKEAFTTLSRFYIDIHDFNLIELKLFDSYGSHDTRSKVLNLLTKISQSGESLDMSPGEQEIDLVYISDILEAIQISANRLHKRSLKGLNRFGLKGQSRSSLKEVVAVFEKVKKTKLNINWGKRPYRPREIMTLWNPKKSLPEWNAAIGLEEGLKLMEKENEKDCHLYSGL